MKLRTLLFTIAAVLALPSTAQYYVGGDISMLPSYEAAGAGYIDENGQTITDMLQYLKGQGLNSLRVRLFVDPTQATTAERNQGARQDLDYVKTLCQRIKAAGFSLMLDFHYSDTWADPAQQWTPASWQSLTDDQLQQKIYDYTKDCLLQLVAANATPDFIQTGNEISYGLLWGARGTNANRCFTNSAASTWQRFYALLKQAGRACREVCPQAKIILHSERVPKVDVLKDYFDRMKANAIDYDVIGLSYYPYHHGSLAQLEKALQQAESYDKDIMIVETGYYYAWYPSDAGFNMTSTWSATPAGQKTFANALIEKLKSHERVVGLYWWYLEACENNIPWQQAVTPSGWYNASLFNDTNTSDVGWPAGKVMPAMQALKAFAERGEASVNTIKETAINGQWYNLQGVQFNSRPQRRGLYIHDGRKVFVK